MGTTSKPAKRMPPPVRVPQRAKRSTLDYVNKTSYKARPLDQLCLEHAPGDTISDRIRAIFDDYDQKSRTGEIRPHRVDLPRRFEYTYHTKMISWHQSIDHWTMLEDIRDAFQYRMAADAIRHVFDHYAAHEGLVRDRRATQARRSA